MSRAQRKPNATVLQKIKNSHLIFIPQDNPDLLHPKTSTSLDNTHLGFVQFQISWQTTKQRQIHPPIAVKSKANNACACKSAVPFRYCMGNDETVHWVCTKSHPLSGFIIGRLSSLCTLLLISIHQLFDSIIHFLRQRQPKGRTMTYSLFFPPCLLWSALWFPGLGGSALSSVFVGWLCFRCFGAAARPLPLFIPLHRWRWSAL